MDAETIIKMIKESKKTTPAICYLSGNLRELDAGSLTFVNGNDFGILSGNLKEIRAFIEKNSGKIEGHFIEVRARNSALPLADISKYEARIEPGAIIRDMVEIGRNAVIMMGAVLNIGAVIGEGTMIDMNVVVGGRAIVGKNCHIGAGAVLAGVVEPPSASPVRIGDNVVVGANAVILEGVEVGQNSVIAAGAVVTKDIPPYSVAAGLPARVIKQYDEKTASKTQIVKDLREIQEQ
jgi:2,3,4,5-tetrahydropyridine-2-carboxylate N-succinyltransferase/tetrahydrodipicolinate N-acetyltransferase